MRREVFTLILLSCAALPACEARFTDERRATADLARPVDSAPLDGGAPGAVAAGSFGGRGGFAGAGRAQLHRLDNGALELRFDDDFLVTPTAGAVVVLSTRDDLGNRIDGDAGDLVLGPLQAAGGAQAYAVPGSDDPRRRVFVFSPPFGVEVALAVLEAGAP